MKNKTRNKILMAFLPILPHLLYLLPLALFTACNMKARNSHKTISSQEAQGMMNENAIVLDVRNPEEFQSGHIPGAILLPHNLIREQARYLLPDYNQTILIYCRSGNRSNMAALVLTELGYTAVYDFGGIVDWHGEITLPS